MLSKKEVVDILKKGGALRKGHFKLSSGLHTAGYIQMALVLQYPSYAAKLCEELAELFKNEPIDVVASPALGGILIGQKVAEIRGARAIFAEKEEKKLILRRGFKIYPGEKVLIVEDVITTGGSVKKIIEIVEKSKGEVVGVGCIVDRSGESVDFTLNKNILKPKSLLTLEIKNYLEKE
ncbi:MAG: orotate phosphoribosyltransferase, partial [Candidatus Aerophobetes bacterium]|nr:orotate phosphoribosyltransferase [Candidatus Aerophobetes bacterium]